MIHLKQQLNTEIESKLLFKLQNYAVKKFNSNNSEIVEEAVKIYLKEHPIKNSDLSVKEIIKKGSLCSLLKPRETRKVVNILKNEHVYDHGKGEYLPPDDNANNLYYVLSGTYYERREIPSSHGSISMTQDLIINDEIFGEEFIGDTFSSFWEPSPVGRVLKISPDAKNELIRKVPKIRENIEYLIAQKFRKMDYISTVRNNHLTAEDKVKYGFNFLVQRLGQTMNGDSSKREVSIKFHGSELPMGYYSDYGKLKRIMHEDVGDLLSLSRESVSRVLNNMCFNLNENNFRISFKQNGSTYIFKDLLNEDGKVIKLCNLNN